MPSAGEPALWTTQGDAEVKLRMGDSGLAAEPPLTVHQALASAVERFGERTALSWKDGEQRKSLSYREYYQACRTAAKSFLKVFEWLTSSVFPWRRNSFKFSLSLCSLDYSVATASESWVSTRPSGSSPTSAPFWRGECPRRCPCLLLAPKLGVTSHTSCARKS